mgnify:CR=1 FL=1
MRYSRESLGFAAVILYNDKIAKVAMIAKVAIVAIVAMIATLKCQCSRPTACCTGDIVYVFA